MPLTLEEIVKIAIENQHLILEQELKKGVPPGQTHVASNYLKLFATNNQYSLLYINNFK